MGLFGRNKTVFVESDILVIGGGMAGCGATYESRYWGRDLKVVCVEKANIERSGAVAQGLYAINCYMGMQWDENQPEDHVRYARNDLMGLVREDLGYDIARHVDSTVHKFEQPSSLSVSPSRISFPIFVFGFLRFKSELIIFHCFHKHFHVRQR